MTIGRWFASSANQLQEIYAGSFKIGNQVSQLVWLSRAARTLRGSRFRMSMTPRLN
jgi:hypothetical protein